MINYIKGFYYPKLTLKSTIRERIDEYNAAPFIGWIVFTSIH